MNKKNVRKKWWLLFAVILGVILLLYIMFYWLVYGFFDDTRGVSNSIRDSKFRHTFICEYEQAAESNITFDYMIFPNTCKHIWLEKAWYYQNWGKIEITPNDYTLRVDIASKQGTFNGYSFNRDWSLTLRNNAGPHYISDVHATSRGKRDILDGLLKAPERLDTIIFNVVKNKEPKGQLILVRKKEDKQL